MDAVISKGIKLSYKTAEGADFIDLADLQNIPDLGGDTESIEITTMDSEAHEYTEGILNYGDTLPFTFLYKTEQFNTLKGLKGQIISWKVTLPDSATCTFDGKGSVKLAGVGVNNALTYTLNIKPSSEMAWG
ncbi:MAG: hypothetical protein IKB64_03190 [Paludibacteraceae bacterium]|nr:hypothetical protein [Paludibacteraceae bacterium]